MIDDNTFSEKQWQRHERRPATKFIHKERLASYVGFEPPSQFGASETAEGYLTKPEQNGASLENGFQPSVWADFVERNAELISQLEEIRKAQDRCEAVFQIANLSAEEKVVARLSILQGKSYPEIAAETDKALSTVKTLMRRAKAKLASQGDSNGQSN